MAFDYNKTDIKFFNITHPWRGGAFHWNELKFNGGDIYWSFRLGPFLWKIKG